jgi:hypothetical protein
MPELLADARPWLRTLLPPRDPVKGCEDKNRSQRDPTMERGRFCTHTRKSEKQFLPNSCRADTYLQNYPTESVGTQKLLHYLSTKWIPG